MTEIIRTPLKRQDYWVESLTSLGKTPSLCFCGSEFFRLWPSLKNKSRPMELIISKEPLREAHQIRLYRSKSSDHPDRIRVSIQGRTDKLKNFREDLLLMNSDFIKGNLKVPGTYWVAIDIL